MRSPRKRTSGPSLPTCSSPVFLYSRKPLFVQLLQGRSQRGGPRDQNDGPIVLLDGWLDEVDSSKFLGIFLDVGLTWIVHIDHVLMTAYYGFVYPHLIYGLVLWGASANSQFHRARQVLLVANPVYNFAERLEPIFRHCAALDIMSSLFKGHPLKSCAELRSKCFDLYAAGRGAHSIDKANEREARIGEVTVCNANPHLPQIAYPSRTSTEYRLLYSPSVTEQYNELHLKERLSNKTKRSRVQWRGESGA
ncbi:hypothetical protein J6590_102860 [Homalodisca vitripennis]|nr:hypothetical protein J6590_102860 [Homalodisca vitripennis]